MFAASLLLPASAASVEWGDLDDEPSTLSVSQKHIPVPASTGIKISSTTSQIATTVIGTSNANNKAPFTSSVTPQATSTPVSVPIVSSAVSKGNVVAGGGPASSMSSSSSNVQANRVTHANGQQQFTQATPPSGFNGGVSGASTSAIIQSSTSTGLVNHNNQQQPSPSSSQAQPSSVPSRAVFSYKAAVVASTTSAASASVSASSPSSSSSSSPSLRAPVTSVQSVGSMAPGGSGASVQPISSPSSSGHVSTSISSPPVAASSSPSFSFNGASYNPTKSIATSKLAGSEGGFSTSPMQMQFVGQGQQQQQQQQQRSGLVTHNAEVTSANGSSSSPNASILRVATGDSPVSAKRVQLRAEAQEFVPSFVSSGGSK